MEPPTVRTVTVFIPGESCQPEEVFHAAVATACAQAIKVRDRLQAAGVPVQTTRVAVPGPAAFPSREAALEAAKTLDSCDVDYANLGTIHPSDPAYLLDPLFVLDVLRATKNVFLTRTVTESGDKISQASAQAAAQVTAAAAALEPHGMANMRFAALANVRPGCPFFPAAHATATCTDGTFATSLGVQAVDLLRVSATAEALTAAVETAAKQLVSVCKASGTDVTCDFSLAPFPGLDCSVARGLARYAGGASFGAPGTVAGAAALASALDKACFPRAGFSGLMLAVAEDELLAGSKRPVRMNDLLVTSAVCGVGLDAVPVPGDTSVDAMYRVVLDVAAMSVRLGAKQLTVRLLPLPGLQAGDKTRFEWPFLVNGPVVAVEGDGAAQAAPGGGGEELAIRPLAFLSR